jgi:hypothetical protein
VGILQPPVLQERPGGRLVPVLGRRRLRAAVEADIGAADVRIVDPQMPEPEGFELAFWDNAAHRIVDPASKAVVVRRLLGLFSRQRVAQEFLPILEVPPLGPRMERMMAIGSLEGPVLALLATGRIHEKTTAIFAALGSAERGSLVELLERLGMNANKNAEVVSNLYDLSILRNESVCQIVGAAEACAILQDEDLPVPERAARFRDLVRSWKFPQLVRRESEFRLWLQDLSRREGVRIHPATSFETDECTIEIQARSRKQAEEILNRIADGDTRRDSQ